MRELIQINAVAILLGLTGLMLAGCGESSSDAQNQTPVEIHGELISSTKTAAASVPGVPPAQPVTKPEAVASDYAVVGFDKLSSYPYEVDDTPVTNQAAGADKANDQIPAYIKDFDKKKISLKGFMMPIKVSNGSVSEFLIMRNQSLCCFGTVPRINEWVSVKTTGPGVKPIMDVPVSICGTLRVGAVRENGYLIGIYRMDGDKLVADN